MNLDNIRILKIIDQEAKQFSGCTKVQVGAMIRIPQQNQGEFMEISGYNSDYFEKCKKEGCLRVEKYGNNDKTHRQPGDCRAIHSEIEVICQAAAMGIDISGSTIYVTRYPCEHCALAITSAGIRKVVYGRKQKISEFTTELFEKYNVEVVHEEEFDIEDVTT